MGAGRHKRTENTSWHKCTETAPCVGSPAGGGINIPDAAFWRHRRIRIGEQRGRAVHTPQVAYSGLRLQRGRSGAYVYPWAYGGLLQDSGGGRRQHHKGAGLPSWAWRILRLPGIGGGKSLHLRVWNMQWRDRRNTGR